MRGRRSSLVDAAQGIEAQTLANCYLALENDLEIVAALNKIDLPAAEPDRYAEEIEQRPRHPGDEILRISAKTGEGVPELLDAVVERIPAPTGDPDAPLQALIFDSYFDQYRGVVSSVRVMNGTLTTGARLRFMQAGADPRRRRDRRPPPRHRRRWPALGPGEVGYLIAGIKDVGEARSGETVTDAAPAGRGARRATATRSRWCSAGCIPVDGDEFADLREALEKLRLNDCELHLRARDLGRARASGSGAASSGCCTWRSCASGSSASSTSSLIATAPSVEYLVHTTEGRDRRGRQPERDAARRSEIEAIEEPCLSVTILTPTDYTGTLMDLCQTRRGEMQQARVPLARAGRARLPDAAGRGRRSTSSIS